VPTAAATVNTGVLFTSEISYVSLARLIEQVTSVEEVQPVVEHIAVALSSFSVAVGVRSTAAKFNPRTVTVPPSDCCALVLARNDTTGASYVKAWDLVPTTAETVMAPVRACPTAATGGAHMTDVSELHWVVAQT